MTASSNEVERRMVIDEMTPMACPHLASLSLAGVALAVEDEKPEGPNHKAWRLKLQKAFAKRLREEGFTKNEIEKIVKDMLKGLWGILKNLWRLYKALRAYRKAKKDVGPEPAWEQ